MTEVLLATNAVTLTLLALALRANRRWARAYGARRHRTTEPLAPTVHLTAAPGEEDIERVRSRMQHMKGYL